MYIIHTCSPPSGLQDTEPRTPPYPGGQRRPSEDLETTRPRDGMLMIFPDVSKFLPSIYGPKDNMG